MQHRSGGLKSRGWKCPCCQNPWNESESLPLYAVSCQPCLQTSNGIQGIEISNFDDNISLKENFFNWSNGGWVASNPIPNEYSEWNTFLQLRDLNLDRIKEMVNELEEKTQYETKEEQQLQIFYKAMMNEAMINDRGIEPLCPIFDLCSQIKVWSTLSLSHTHTSCLISISYLQERLLQNYI
jgi:predicted metalloendopeptidase